MSSASVSAEEEALSEEEEPVAPPQPVKPVANRQETIAKIVRVYALYPELHATSDQEMEFLEQLNGLGLKQLVDMLDVLEMRVRSRTYLDASLPLRLFAKMIAIITGAPDQEQKVLDDKKFERALGEQLGTVSDWLPNWSKIIWFISAHLAEGMSKEYEDKTDEPKIV